MSLLTTANLSKLSRDERDDDARSVSSTGSVGSAMANKFNMNITRKMQHVRTENDVVNAMTRETKDNKDAFWSYVERKATRKLNKMLALTAVEQIALNRKNVTNNEGKQKELGTKTIMEMFAKNTEVSAKTNDFGSYNMIIQTALFM